ncbi:MAG: hypothetical protein XXXJIFNMEKO3_00172 [Candidatus Erwinia impunctatus]|nr:hypothetical protein XXXJIFNMEKO_00172 [Culicoides impunctatus]
MSLMRVADTSTQQNWIYPESENALYSKNVFISRGPGFPATYITVTILSCSGKNTTGVITQG